MIAIVSGIIFGVVLGIGLRLRLSILKAAKCIYFNGLPLKYWLAVQSIFSKASIAVIRMVQTSRRDEEVIRRVTAGIFKLKTSFCLRLCRTSYACLLYFNNTIVYLSSGCCWNGAWINLSLSFFKLDTFKGFSSLSLYVKYKNFIGAKPDTTRF